MAEQAVLFLTVDADAGELLEAPKRVDQAELCLVRETVAKKSAAILAGWGNGVFFKNDATTPNFTKFRNYTKITQFKSQKYFQLML